MAWIQASMLPIQEDRVPHVGVHEGVHAEGLPRIDHSLRIEDFDGLEAYLTACVSHERFRSVHLGAYERWSQASAIIYRDSARESLLAAGREAHEALQEFARAVSEPPHSRITSDPDSTEATAGRLRAFTDAYRSQLGDARCELLQALLEHWRALIDQLQNHVYEREMVDEPLRWEDARRVVILTALVMVEIDRSF
jgi:hypothetical protein